MNPIEKWVNQSAVATGRAYSAWTSIPDVRQHLWSWAYANEAKVSEYLAHQDGERIIRSILNQEARNYAARERAVSTGYEYDDVAWYTITAIRRVLPDVFDYADWQSFELKGGGPSNKPAAWSGDKLATLIDIKGALDSLPAERVTLLRRHYGDGLTVEACATLENVSVEACSKRIQRALKALSRALNDPRPVDPMEGATYEQWKANQHFYDTRSKFRKAMSNAASRAATDGNYGD